MKIIKRPGARPIIPVIAPQENLDAIQPIEGVPTSITAFIGMAASGPVNKATVINSFADFESIFGGLWVRSTMSYAVKDFYLNGGSSALVVRLVRTVGGDDGENLLAEQYEGNENNRTGLWALHQEDFNILCIPPAIPEEDTAPSVYQQALILCAENHAILIVDAPVSWGASATPYNSALTGLGRLGLQGPNASNAALYFPLIKQPDPESEGQIKTRVPCGMIAGIMARTDRTKGVWRSPAGPDAALTSVAELQMIVSDAENDLLSQLGINCLRSFPGKGHLVWGTRTLAGAAHLSDEFRYINVKRTALYLKESIYKGTEWAKNESNNELLWSGIRSQIEIFLHSLFLKGAFQGQTPNKAYFVKCGIDTNSTAGIISGSLNITVGVALLKPAEFIILKIQHQISENSAKPVLIKTNTRWDGLVLTEKQKIALKEIIEFNSSRNPLQRSARVKKQHSGTIVLFEGGPGTDKNMAAEVLSNETGLDLYKVHSGQIKSKYIGETEKNLDRIFDAAGKDKAILFFDEADALFGKRTEIKDSHDRYSNIEVNYLLQKLESHPAIIILSANNKAAFKKTFLKQVRHIVQFP